MSRAATPRPGDTLPKRKADTYMPPPSRYDPNKGNKSALLKPTPTYQMPAYVPGPTYAQSGASTMDLDFPGLARPEWKRQRVPR